jgi:hypothetical protein
MGTTGRRLEILIQNGKEKHINLSGHTEKRPEIGEYVGGIQENRNLDAY